MKRTLGIFSLLFLLAAFAAACNDDTSEPSATPAAESSPAAEPTKASGDVILATTTSFQDSGLLDVLKDRFEQETGYTLKPIAVGSGQAIEQASRGDADVVLAHSPAAEKKMIDAGDGIERTLVMHNDFVIVGPAADPAGLAAANDARAAMTALAAGAAPFISRGDDSGTHALELKLWSGAAIDPARQSWYEESGQGMGATLQIANQKAGYTVTDRGTYLAQKANLDLEILFEGDGSLLNYYHVILVNPEKHAGVNADGARAFAAFLLRDDIQQIIGAFGVEEYGQPLFVPDAGKEDPTA